MATNNNQEIIASLGRIATATGTTLHPDAIAYRDGLLSYGGLISPAQLRALSNMAQSLQDAGLRSKVLHISPMAGTNLRSAAYKFYSEPIEDRPDLQVVNYVESDYSPALGLKGGISKRIGTRLFADKSRLVANGSLGLGYSAGVGFYCTENAGGGASNLDITVTPIPSTNIISFRVGSLTRSEIYRNDATAVQEITPNRSGFIFATRLDNSHRLYDDGVLFATTNATASIEELPPAQFIFQGRGATLSSNNRGRLYCVTLGLTDAEAIAFSTIMKTCGDALATP